MDAPAAAVSADGKRTALAWMAQPDNDRDVFWRANGWKQERLLDPAREGAQGHTALAFDAAGALHAVWVSLDRIRYRTLDAAGKASAPRTVSRDGERAGQPALAARGRRVVLVYELKRGAVIRRLGS